MPPNQLIEQEIQFKKRARRRLVGAIALVLLMVTVLPMILDDRAAKPQQQQEITITIPSQDGTDFTSKVVPVVPAAPLPESNPDNLVAEQAPKESANTTESLPPAALGKDTNETKAPAPNKEEAKIVSQNAAKPALTETKGESYGVQIGVFSDMSSIAKLQQQLQALGYKSYTEKIKTPNGEKIRLRTDPVTDRAQAEKALSVIKNSGLSGMVVVNKKDS